MEEWRASCGNSVGSGLFDIGPAVGECQLVVQGIGGEEVVLAGLHLGHAGVTHLYLLQGEERPQCAGFDAPFAVRRFLLECGDFAQVGSGCFHVDSMKQLFQDIHIDGVVTVLKEINLFNGV